MCPYCGGRDVIKSGKRYNLAGALQLYRCSACSRKFSRRPAGHTTYPLHAIIETLSLYDRGYTLEESARRAGKRHRVSITKQLAASWKSRYASFFPYFRLRDTVAAAHPPHTLVLSARLHHGQVYEFSYHPGKTEHLLRGGSSASRSPFRPQQPQYAPAASFEALRHFLESVPTDTPHDLFRAQAKRASQTRQRFSLADVAIIERKNAAVEMAGFVIPTVSRNTKRHETIQEFMLVNDSVTVAVEVPVYLTEADVRHFTETLGFSIPFRARGQARHHRPHRPRCRSGTV